MAITVGTQLGSHVVTGFIGRGGMGEVYRARDTKLKREVAIKVLPEEFSRDPDRVSRFQREAEVLALLNHPNIGAIYSLEEANGMRFLVLELVDGETLAERIARGPIPIDESLVIAKQIAAALEAAHEREIVHRDLKPANVKITPDGRLKVLDFGLARAPVSPDPEATAGRDMTLAGEILGTAAYMSPEQVRGDRVGFQSDQFSLGIILFEMLAGRHPFSGNSSVEILASILRDGPPALGELNPDVPSPVQWIVERCLAKQPKERYASTRDLAGDLAMLGDRLSRQEAARVRLGPSTLPVPRTSLIGREADLARACALLMRDDLRLVTFTGTAGTGKTRLALEAAAACVHAFPGGVFFVALASIRDPSLVASTVAQALGIRETRGREPAEALKEALRLAPECILLLLDNFEQVLDAAPLLTVLLESCSRLKLLVTSRAMLRVYGEHVFEVPPLQLPAHDASSQLEELSRCPSVALFLQRAAAVKPDFTLTKDNAAAIAEICARLDGLPLAIELAAARVRTLTPKAMLNRLGGRFELLTGGSRDLPERQQTLRAAVAWSYGLLNPEEQKLLRRLAVFVNGCTLEAVEAVCNAGEDLSTNVLDIMESLAGQSLIQQTQTPDGESRFTMLETIRDYALEQLAASPDEALTHRAHAAYFLVLAEEGGQSDTTAEHEAWLDRCNLERDNFRAGLDWTVREKNAEWGLRMGAAIYVFWMGRQGYAEGRDRLAELLRLPAEGKAQSARMRALHGAGSLALLQGDYAAARLLNEEQLTVSRAMGDTVGIMSALFSLAINEHVLGNRDSARAILEECLKLSQDANNELAIARTLTQLSFFLESSRDFAGAKPLCERALAILLRLEDWTGAAWEQSRLGDIERQLGNPDAASAAYEGALAAFERLGDRAGLARTKVDAGVLLFEQGKKHEARAVLAQALTSLRDLGNGTGIARALAEFAGFAAATGKAERALRLAGAADAIRRSIGVDKRWFVLPRQLDSARQALGPRALDVELYGWSMSIDAAIAYALNEDAEG